jgi:TonB-dependent starch-binding outer membrane protein SusC
MENQKTRKSGEIVFPGITLYFLIMAFLFQISAQSAYSSDSGISSTEIIVENSVSMGLPQQPVVITGKVLDENGNPLTGVTIAVKGTTKGVVTNLKGEFNIEVAPEDKVLIFSYVGYLTQEIDIENKTVIDISLEEDKIGLEEVVVVGYGTQKKASITGSVASIKSEDFIEGSFSNPIELIRGKVAGLAINRTNGNPNSDGVQLMLRGVSTLSGDSQPLYVIDGIPSGNLSMLSPDDIESVDVLKDGSAAAIYGTRGTNGVILITTKKGATVAGKPTVTYHSYFSTESILNQIDVFSADEYRKIPEKTDGFFEIVDQGASTDWWDEVSHNPFSQTHNLSIKGGSSSSNYIAAVNYRSQEGLIINTGMEEIQYRLGLNHSTLDDRLRFSLNVNNTIRDGQTNDQNGIYFTTRISNPTEPVFGATGAYTIFSGTNNAVQMANEYVEDINWNTTMVNGKVVAEPIDGLNFTIIGALQRFSNINGSYENRLYNTSRTGTARRSTSMNQRKTFEAYADYNKQFKGHDITILGGYSYQDYNAEGFNLMNYNFPSDVFGYNRPDLGYELQEGNANMGGYKNMSKLIAFFGRLNYSLDNKYLFSASVRREGSTKFGENNKWGIFPAVSAGWKISQEGFMSTLDFINDLKIRVGYGVTGTEPSSPYLSMMRFDYDSPTYYEGKFIYSVGPSENANPNLKWETKHETDIGLDFLILNKRIGGSFDYYVRNTNDLLYTYNVPVPPNFVSTILANVGEVSNSGIELVLNASIINKQDFDWSVTGNFSRNTNELKKLSSEEYSRDFLETGNTGAPVQKPTHLVEEGEPLGNFYGWKSIGLDSLGAWIVEGEYGTMSDRQILGNGIPKMFAGLTSNLRYKNFDFSISIRGAFDYQILNQHRMLWENFIKGQQYNFPTNILKHPYGSTAWIKTEPAYVSYYLEDGDYVKIDNITLGYNFKLNNKKYIKFARVYVSGLNLYTFTKYLGVDPEVNFLGLSPGFDGTGGYPTTKTFTGGIKISF